MGLGTERLREARYREGGIDGDAMQGGQDKEGDKTGRLGRSGDDTSTVTGLEDVTVLSPSVAPSVRPSVLPQSLRANIVSLSIAPFLYCASLNPAIFCNQVKNHVWPESGLGCQRAQRRLLSGRPGENAIQEDEIHRDAKHEDVIQGEHDTWETR